MTERNPVHIGYLRNPDVVLREEDEDGGLLFNPDTNQVKVVNSTGLSIWKVCDGSRTPDEIARILLDEYEGASLEQANADVRDYLADMVESGFIGKLD